MHLRYFIFVVIIIFLSSLCLVLISDMMTMLLQKWIFFPYSKQKSQISQLQEKWNYHVSQKKLACKTTDKYDAVQQSTLNKIPSFTYHIITLFTYHKQKLGMIFICQFSRYDFKSKLTRRSTFVIFLLSARLVSHRS